MIDLDTLPPTVGASIVAEVLGISKSTVHELVRRGECPVEHLHLGRRVRFKSASLRRLVACSERDDALGGETQGASSIVSLSSPKHEGGRRASSG